MRVVLLACLGAAPIASAAVTLNSLFTDGMVLQSRDSYGQRSFFYVLASPGETVVTNRTSASGGLETYSAVADADGAWISQWDADTSSANFTVTIAGSADGYRAVQTIRDVTYGDVYVCAGE